MKPRLTALCFAAAFLLFYGRLLFGVNYLWEDVIEQHYPNIVYTMHSLKQGELPHWTPYVFGGMPYMADMQTGLFYPPNWLLFLAHTFTEPGGIVFIWFVLLHILVFGIGIFLLARGFGLGREASLLAALACMFSGYVSVHVNHVIFLYVIAWFPYTFLFLKKAFEARRLRFLGLSALFFGVSILGGYAQYTLFCVSILFLYTVFKTWESRKIVPFAYFGIAMTISFGLAMVQYLPTLELSGESVRTSMTWEESVQGSLGLGNFLTFLAPKFYGWVSGLTDVNRATGAWAHGAPFWGGQGMHLFWETAVFIGILPLLLVAAGAPYLFRRKWFIFFTVLALLALLAALGKNGPLYYVLFHLPGFGKFRHPGRYAFISTFGLLMASGMSFHYLITAPKDSLAGFKKGLIALAVTGGVFLIVLIGAALSVPSLEESHRPAAMQAAVFGTVSVLLGAALILMLLRPKTQKAAAWAVLAFTFLELYLFGHLFGCGKVTGKNVYPRVSSVERVRKTIEALESLRLEIDREPFRIQGRIFEGEGKGVRLFGSHLNMGNVYRLPTIEGYNQLHLKRLSQFLHEADPVKGMNLFNVKMRPRPDGAGFYNVPGNAYCRRFNLRNRIITVQSDSAAMRTINGPGFDPMVHAVVESPLTIPVDSAVPVDSLGQITILSYGPNRIELSVQAARNCLLFASEVFYPAWRALLDGKETGIHHTNYLFRGVEIPKGLHKLVFVYKSGAFRLGIVLSLLSLALVMVLIFARLSVRVIARSRPAAGEDGDEAISRNA